MKKSFGEDKAKQVDSFVKEIPKMHLVGHKDECQIPFSFNYIRGVGRTDGEAIERFWAEANQLAASTKQMNAGHRHDKINDHCGGSNWYKGKQLR